MLNAGKKEGQEKTITKSVIILTFAFALRYVLSFIIQPLIAYKFGATPATDAFIIASMIPTIISDSLIGSVLGFVLVPAFIKIRMQKNETEAQRVANTIFTASALILCLFSVAYVIFAKQLVNLLAPGLPDNAKYQAVVMSRIIAPNFLFFFLILFYKSIFSAYKYFTLPAYSPLLFSLGLFLSIIFLSGKIGIYSLAVGTLLGGVLQTIILIIFLNKVNFKLSFALFLKHPSVGEIFFLSIPLGLYVMTQNINVIIFRFLASRLQQGGIASLNFSDQLTQTIAALFVSALSVVILPFFSQYAAANEMDKLKNLFTTSVKFLLIIVIPISVLLWVFSHPIVSVLFGRGAFDAKATDLTALNLKYYTIGFWAYCIILILLQVYYSLGKTKTIYKTGMVPIVLNIFLSVVLIRYLNVSGIALASSLTRNLIFLTLLYLLYKEWKMSILNKKTVEFLLKIGLATLVMGIFAKGVFVYLQNLPLPVIGSKPEAVPLVCVIILAGIIFLGVARLLKLKEVNELIELFKLRLFKKRIEPGRETVILP